MKRGKVGGQSALERLLHTTSGEDNRKSNIRSWLESEGFDIEGEWETGDGPVDLYLPNNRVLIETKRASRLDAGPNAKGTGSKGDETAFEQIQRYILAERGRERLYADDAVQSKTWFGAVTDKRRWWIWEWPARGGEMSHPLSAWQNHTLNSTSAAALARLFHRPVGKPWAPRDVSWLFEDSLERLRKLYERERDVPATITQRGLWLQQLRAGGNAPTDDIDGMFVRHTLLILITRLIMRTIHDTNEINAGFVRWVPEASDIVQKLAGTSVAR